MSSTAKHFKSVTERSLLFGTVESVDQNGNLVRDCLLEGTPDGLRVLASFLNEMAETVEQNESIERAWSVSLSPAEMPALVGQYVRSLQLRCQRDSVAEPTDRGNS